jgi:PAS domain S-box-containing protein
MSEDKATTPSVRMGDGERAQREARWQALLAGMLDPVVTIDALGTIQRYRRTGETGILNRTREFQVVRKDGALLTCELSVSRVDVPGDAAPLFVGSFRDVSARRKAEEELRRSEQLLRVLFDQEFQFVGLLTKEGRVLEINRTALEAAGLTREQVIGRPFAEVGWWRDSPRDEKRLRQAIVSAARGEFVRFETLLRRASGEAIDVDFSLKPIRDEHGEVILLLPEGRDVTQIRDAQRRETGMLRALATIGESASLLAHEIKNPITGIHLALRAVADQLGEEHQAVLQDLVERLQKLERTMRRTLSFARPIVLDRRRITPRALLEGAAHALRPEFERAGVALEVVADKDLPEIDVDVALLEEALGNLLKNALEVRMDGGRVLLTATRNVSEGLVLTVEDDGPGISPKVAPELFKPFVSDKVGGTGLGLALCKRIVEEHGGRILCGKSTLGGACFGLHLPLPGRTVRLHQAHLRSQA